MPYKDPIKRKEYIEKNKDRIKKMNKDWYEKNQDHVKKYREKYYKENHETILEKKKKYQKEHRDELNKKSKQYYYENKEKINQQSKEYREKHRDEVNEYLRKYRKEPAKYDTLYEKLLPYYKDSIRRDPNNPELFQVQCFYSQCKKWFNPTNQDVSDRYKAIMGKYKRSHGSHNLYCSDDCKKNCPIFRKIEWPKGFDPHQDYSRDDQPQLRELVLERDNYTCQREGCGKSLAEYPDLQLVCHHIFPLNEDPVCSADLDNCITVCVDCHRWIHQNIPGCGYHEMKCSK